MKVVLRKPIIERIFDEKMKADEAMREIEKIELDLGECRRLRREIGDMRLYCYADVVPSTSLFSLGRKITKGDWCMVAGVRIEATESE